MSFIKNEWVKHNETIIDMKTRNRQYSFGSSASATHPQYWRNDAGQLHRDENDLPAVIYANGNKTWFQNGAIYRKNGLPPLLLANGTESYWFRDGFLYMDAECKHRWEPGEEKLRLPFKPTQHHA